MRIPVESVHAYEEGLYTFLDSDPDGLAFMEAVRNTGKLEESAENSLKSALNTYTEKFLQESEQ